MYKIDTASPRWRRLAVTSLALPLSFALSGTAMATGPQSEADLSISVSCFGIDVESDKDISNVKVTFADGTSEELSLTGLTFSKTYDKQIASATAKSGTTEVPGTPTGCSTAPAGPVPVEVVPVEVVPVVVPVKDQPLPDTANGTAAITITVDCRTVSVTSDKDISNVKVTFADGSFQEINGLSGYTFERTFSKDIDFATSKSATTEVLGDAKACAVVVPEVVPVVVPVVIKPIVVPVVVTPVVVDTTPVVVDTTPIVVDTTPVCPTEQVMGPVMAGCDTPAAPITGQPVALPANGGSTPVVTEDTPVVTEDTPVVTEDAPVAAEEAPVVAEETPEQSTVGTPVAGAPAPQAAVGAAGAVPAPAAGMPAQAPATVIAHGAVAPAAVTPAVAPAELATVAAPATLPFTGTDTDALLALGSVLVMAGGGALLAGRRQRTATHVRTAKHARLA